MKYKYRAINTNGEVIEDQIIANSKEDVLEMIKSKRLLTLSIEEVFQYDFSKRFTSRKVKKKDLVVFCRLFYTMLNAGVNISKSLEIIANSTKNTKMKLALNEVNTDIHNGIYLSDALEKHKHIFPIMFIEMIRAGEISGNLDEIINRLGEYYYNQYKIENRVKSSLVYPVLIIILSVLVIVFMLALVLPVFYDIFSSRNLSLPLPTILLIQISNTIRNHWTTIIILLQVIILGLRSYFKRPRGRKLIDLLKLKTPFIRDLYIKIASANFTKTLSILLSSGIPLIRSLTMSSNVLNNIIIKNKLEKQINKVEEGKKLSESIGDIRIFSSVVDAMIRVGEETGALDEMLLKTSIFYDEEVRTSLERMTKLIEPILMIIVGFIVGFIVLSLALPMFEIMYAI